jgi:DivIVA domain-containing protein
VTPEDITSRTFLVSLRGYDRDEVHAFLEQVAEELQELQHRNAELEQPLAAASSDDPEAVAVAAAAAREAAAADPAGVATQPSDVFAHIGRETQRILEAAQEAGHDLRQRAADESERQVRDAKVRAAEIIAEGERRREAIEVNVTQLTDARDQLAGRLLDLGRQVERSLEELLPETEAAPRVGGRERTSARAGGASPFVRASAGVAVANGEESAEDDPERAAPEASSAAAEEPDAAPEATALSEGRGANGSAASWADVPHVDEPSLRTDGGGAQVGVETGVPAAAADHGRADVSVPAPQPDSEPSAFIPELTHRQASAADGADGVSMEPPAAAERPFPIERDIDPGVLDQAQALRAQALAPLHPKLVRKLKRGLQDVQNGVLDQLRRADGTGEPAAFLPDAEAFAALGQLSEKFLASAWWAGCASGELLSDREVDVPNPLTGFSDELTAALTRELTAGLEEELRLGIEAGDDVEELGERVGEVFAEVREAPVEEQSALALLRTYEEGMRTSWQVGGSTHRLWARATEPPCTDPRCDDNHRAGPVPLEEPFPSGHHVPPSRVGCNCTTLPAIPESEPAS